MFGINYYFCLLYGYCPLLPIIINVACPFDSTLWCDGWLLDCIPLSILESMREYIIITANQQSCGEVLFSVVPVCHSVHNGGRGVPCDHYPWWIVGNHHTGTPCTGRWPSPFPVQGPSPGFPTYRALAPLSLLYRTDPLLCMALPWPLCTGPHHFLPC